MTDLFPAWMLLKRSETEGEWTAHCLELDVVSQGTGPGEAYRMGIEAVLLAMRWDFEAGLDPRSRKQAPAEAFDDLNELLDANHRLDVEQALEDSGFKVIAVRVNFDLDKARKPSAETRTTPDPAPAGKAWSLPTAA